MSVSPSTQDPTGSVKPDPMNACASGYAPPVPGVLGGIAQVTVDPHGAPTRLVSGPCQAPLVVAFANAGDQFMYAQAFGPSPTTDVACQEAVLLGWNTFSSQAPTLTCGILGYQTQPDRLTVTGDTYTITNDYPACDGSGGVLHQETVMTFLGLNADWRQDYTYTQGGVASTIWHAQASLLRAGASGLFG